MKDKHSKILSKSVSYNRFGWYWQPFPFTEMNDPQDVVDATRQAINLNGTKLALEAKSKKVEKQHQRNVMAMKKSLERLSRG